MPTNADEAISNEKMNQQRKKAAYHRFGKD